MGQHNSGRRGAERPCAGGVLRRFARARRGSMSIEFVTLGPIFLIMMFGIVEIGLMSIGRTGVMAGLDDVSRVVRTGRGACLDDADVKRMICRHSMLHDCQDNLTVDKLLFSAGAGADAVSVEEWTSLDAEDLVVIQATYAWDVFSPMLEPFFENEEGFMSITGSVVFKNEAFENASCG